MRYTNRAAAATLIIAATFGTGVTTVARAQTTGSSAAADTLAESGAQALARQDWKHAVEAYTRLTARSGSDAIAWHNLGVALQGDGNLDAAAGAFKRSIALQPPPAAASRLRLARVQALQRDARAAIGELDELAKSSFAPQFSHLYLTQQPDFDAIRSDTGFVRLEIQLENARFPCRASPAAHQLDFWIGEWSVTRAGGGGGRSDISPAVEHCAVIEKWTDRFGGTGTSLNFYDPISKLWRQIYVADAGVILEYAGTFHDNAMWFESVRPTVANGPKTRLTFYHVSADTVRQVFESSVDGGKLWTPSWEGLYVRSASP
jgi:Tfp pilus assembly protein PilF